MGLVESLLTERVVGAQYLNNSKVIYHLHCPFFYYVEGVGWIPFIYYIFPSLEFLGYETMSYIILLALV